LPQGFWPLYCVECGTGFVQHVFSRQPAMGASLSGHQQAADRQVRTSLSYLSSILASASSRCSVTTLSLQVEKSAGGLAEFSDGETDRECDGRMQTPSEVAAAAFSQLCQRPGRCRPCCDVVRNGVSWDGAGERPRWLDGVTVSRPTEVNKEQVERFNIVNNATHARMQTYRDTQEYRHRYQGVAHPPFVTTTDATLDNPTLTVRPASISETEQDSKILVRRELRDIRFIVLLRPSIGRDETEAS
jgi:hypothetical protein